MPSVETGQMSAVETGQMTAAETSVLSQQKTSFLSEQCPRLLLAAASGHGPKSCQEPVSFCVFELATPYSVREGRRSMSPSIDFYNNFSHPSSEDSPPPPSIGLLKSRQNPSVQALFGELALRLVLTQVILTRHADTCLLYTSPSPRDRQKSRMPSSA